MNRCPFKFRRNLLPVSYIRNDFIFFTQHADYIADSVGFVPFRNDDRREIERFIVLDDFF